MTISTREKNRIVRRNLVEVPTRGKHGRLPKSFDPAAASHPLAGLRFIYSRFYLGEKVFEIREAFEIEIHLALAHANEMIVSISHAGDDRGAMKIDNARHLAFIFFRIRIRANENNAIAFYRDCLGMRLFFVDGINIAVDQDQIGNLCGRRGRRRQRKQKQTQRDD